MQLVNSPRKKIILLIFLIAVLAGAGYFAYTMQNTKHEASVEIEHGETSGNGPVIVGEDPEASGGKYIQFEPKQ